MKDREYYERLISDGLDRQLSAEELKQLQEGMRQYPELRSFEEDLRAQAELARKLPELKTEIPLALSEKSRRQRGLLGTVWNIRISVPLPVAALLALLIGGSLLIGIPSWKSPETQPTVQHVRPVEYVQIERLRPAKAVLIETKQKDNPSNKEAL